VDFSPVYKVVPGSPDPFPPTVADPGAVADAEWSSIVVQPSGIVINDQIVASASRTSAGVPLRDRRASNS
jgi:hypothetical protein